MRQIVKNIDKLVTTGTHLELKGGLHGIEKEGLRVDASGALARTAHPRSLGSALTNPAITTDFSESLLELITPVYEDPGAALAFLEKLHGFTYQHIGDELIWAGSMPCSIPDSSTIPLARYGTSNIGQMKYIYRVGLAHRYGRMMQSIAGIHYNFSLPGDFWRSYQRTMGDQSSLELFRSASYFRMIRNFRRHSWLLVYLFGASPALCASFLEGRENRLQKLHDRTLHLPWATSLRMSDLGYSTKVQASLNICFNHLHTYLKSLYHAVQTPYPAYEKIGVKVDGSYRQLNDTILQIENEHYSDVRPKRVARRGERPLEALERAGVEYIEIRNIDVNPLLPVGIDIEQARFLDTFLVSCLLMDESIISQAECDMVSQNMQEVINRGRDPDLCLKTMQGGQPLRETGRQLLDRIQHVAEMLDSVYRGDDYSSSVRAQMEKIENPELTPSARVLKALRDSGSNYSDWILLQSREHRKRFRHDSLTKEAYLELARSAAQSIEKQRELEAGETRSFDDFLADFLDIQMGG
jgi:glutamate--cysteine ligase